MKDAGKLWAEISANNDKLNACPRHFFELPDEAIAEGMGALFGKKLTCLRCHGSLRLTDINQYIRGFEAAGGNPNDVLPGWNGEGQSDGQTQRKYFRGDD